VHRESIDIEEITQRYFLGRCEDTNYVKAVVPIFLEKKAEFYNIIHSFDLLSKEDQEIMSKYLDEFYKIIENPKILKKRVLERCVSK